jgi:sodium/bile acid cotransporter 7
MRPELFIGKFGVTLIFLLSGLSLELNELKSAVANMKLNFLVQAGSFLAWPFLVGVPLIGIIKRVIPNFLPNALLEGLLILTCLPTTVNMCVLLTASAGGNVAASLANAVMGNMLGIFVTPALLMYFFGTAIELPFLQMVLKLINKVLVPVAVGQLLRASTQAKDFFVSHKKTFKSLQEFILVGLVWNAFCNAFTKGIGIEVRHGIFLLALLSSLHLGSFAILMKFFSSKIFNFKRADAIAATFCTSHKTLAFGLPLLNTIFEGNANLAAYCAPVMFIHPLQLLLGSILAERIKNDGEK